MNILFITRGYPSENYKTLGIFEYDMAKALAKSGHEVTYLAVDVRSIRRWRKWGHESFTRDNINIEAINVPLGRIYHPLKTKISEIALFKLFKKISMKNDQFDLIHAHFPDFAYLGAKLKVKTGIPLVITEHSSKLNKPLDGNLERKLTYAYNKADELTCVSKSLAEVIYKKFNIMPSVITNVVDTEIFKLKSVETRNTGVFTFVSAGNLISSKGMDLTIKAFAKIIEKHPNSELLIFGQGPEKDNLMELVKTYGLSEKIKFFGLVSRQVLRQYYERANVFVLASYSETLGVAYIEAIAMGLPVIATDCGGPSDFVHDKNGIMVPRGDVDSLAGVMVNMINHYHEFNFREISDEISEKYSEKSNAMSLENIYKRAIKS